MKQKLILAFKTLVSIPVGIIGLCLAVAAAVLIFRGSVLENFVRDAITGNAPASIAVDPISEAEEIDKTGDPRKVPLIGEWRGKDHCDGIETPVRFIFSRDARFTIHVRSLRYGGTWRVELVEGKDILAMNHTHLIRYYEMEAGDDVLILHHLDVLKERTSCFTVVSPYIF